MSNGPDHDQLTDRLIRRSFEATGKSQDEGCLDAESLAAWTEGGLDVAAAARVERHLSTCAHCQAVLSALVMTETAPAHEAPATSFWNRWSLRWLVPVTAGLSAVLVWTLLRTGPPASGPIQVARSEAPIVAAPPPPTLPDAASATPASPPEPTLDKSTANQASLPVVAPPPPPPSVAREARAAAAEAPATAPAEAPRVQAFRAEQANDSAAGLARAASPGILATAERASAVRSNPNVAFEFVSGTGSRNTADTRQVAPPSAPAGAGRGRGGAFGAAATASAGGGAATGEPPPVVRWRIYADGTVSRSAGQAPDSWQPVLIDPPARLISGSSPSATVVWLVGQEGAVFRSVDGVTFVRVASPAVADLSAVVATGAATASVTAADGRGFTTVDGGQTWRAD